jgi:hypothetical protein
VKAGIGGFLSIFLVVMGVRAIVRLAAPDKPPPVVPSLRLPESRGSYAMRSVPAWKQTLPRIDALLARPRPDPEEARAILRDLGITEARIGVLLLLRPEAADRARLEGLLRAIRGPLPGGDSR